MMISLCPSAATFSCRHHTALKRQLLSAGMGRRTTQALPSASGTHLEVGFTLEQGPARVVTAGMWCLWHPCCAHRPRHDTAQVTFAQCQRAPFVAEPPLLPCPAGRPLPRRMSLTKPHTPAASATAADAAMAATTGTGSAAAGCALAGAWNLRCDA